MKYFFGFLAISLVLTGCSHAPPIEETATDNQIIIEDDVLPSTEEVATDDQVIIKDEALPSDCSDDPVVIDIGRTVHPISEKYSHLKFLGQIFTADDCGGEYMDDIWGVDGGMYTSGVYLKSKGNTTGNVAADLLVRMGFECDKEYDSPGDCIDWTFSGPISIDGLMQLKEFASEFERDDCISCG